ncbi:hypothetical protein niasHT_010247 [Heterodera trifolii]|uniref:HAT C-terminal dimerisation domain-containing protein n=1 Tax=Heterodera trifolii TaxID=157864 RepID=A0ABD2LR91_9BILA
MGVSAIKSHTENRVHKQTDEERRKNTTIESFARSKLALNSIDRQVATAEEVVQLAEQICPEIAQLDELFDEVSAVNQTLAGIPEEFWLKSAEYKWKGIFAADGAIEGYKNLYRVVSAAFSIPTSNAFVERVFSLASSQ